MEKYVTCPFDPTHVMLSGRLTYHIVKCQKRQEANKKICPYNAQHHLSPDLFESHLAECPSRVPLDRNILCQTSTKKVPCHTKSETSEDDWD